MQNAAVNSHGIDDLPADAAILAPDPSGLVRLAAFDHADFALALESLPVSEVPSASVTQRPGVEELDDTRAGEDGQVGDTDVEAEVRAVLTRNILGLFGRHEVPILASLDEFGGPVWVSDLQIPSSRPGLRHRNPSDPDSPCEHAPISTTLTRYRAAPAR